MTKTPDKTPKARDWFDELRPDYQREHRAAVRKRRLKIALYWGAGILDALIISEAIKGRGDPASGLVVVLGGITLFALTMFAVHFFVGDYDK